MKVLGVDPGSARIGYGLIETAPELSLITYGVLEMQSVVHQDRIRELSRSFRKLLGSLRPELAGIETLYFSKNQKTALQVAESRGVLLLHLIEQGITVEELRPGDVKLAVADYALADKTAVSKMVQKMLRVPELTGYDDASDALAIAIAAASVRTWADRTKQGRA